MRTYSVKLTPYAIWYLDYIRTDSPTPAMMRICLARREDELPYTRLTAKDVADGLQELAALAQAQMRDRVLDLDPKTRGAVRAAHNAFTAAAKDIERSLRPVNLD